MINYITLLSATNAVIPRQWNIIFFSTKKIPVKQFLQAWS